MPQRTTLEAYGAIIIAAVIALVQMPWWGLAALLLVLVTLVLDISFHAPMAARLEHRSKIIICLVAETVILLVGLRIVANQYHVDTSHEDLRASFFIEMHEANSFSVEYSFVNEGAAPVSISSLGLTAVMVNNRVDEPSANVNLCQSAHEITRLMMQLMDRAGLSEVANQDLTSKDYLPKNLMVDGSPWPSDIPIDIAGGKSRTVTATYGVDANDQARFNVIALCPVVEARDDIGLGGTAVCRGLLSARTATGLVTIRSAQRVRILPRTRDLLCPPAT